MKRILFFSILFSAIVLPALCQTPQGSVETDIAVIKTEIKNLKEIINNGFGNVQQDFDTVQKIFQQNFDTVQKNFQQNFDTVQKNFDRQITSSLPALVSRGRFSRSAQLCGASWHIGEAEKMTHSKSRLKCLHKKSKHSSNSGLLTHDKRRWYGFPKGICV